MVATPTIFRSLATASIVLALVRVAIDATMDLVPESVRSAEFEARTTEFTIPIVFAVAASVLAAVIALVGFVDLIIFRRWGRKLSMLSTALTFVAYPFLDFVVSSAPAATAHELASMTWGAVLAMSYFSTLSAL